MLDRIADAIELELRHGREIDRVLEAALSACGRSVEHMLHGVEDRSDLHEIAGRSFWHPNGFCKIVLVQPPSGAYQMRLHVWPEPALERAVGDVHSHRWHFASWIVSGVFKHQLFSKAEHRGDLMRHYTWQDDCLDQDPRVGALGTVNLELTAERELHAGDTYYLPPDSLHRFCVVRPGVSVVLQGMPSRNSSDIFRPLSRATPPAIRSQPMTVANLQEVLNQAREQAVTPPPF